MEVGNPARMGVCPKNNNRPLRQGPGILAADRADYVYFPGPFAPFFSAWLDSVLRMVARAAPCRA